MEKKARELVERLKAAINRGSEGLLAQFPVERYIEYLEHYPSAVHYRYVSPRVGEYCGGIIGKSGEKVMELYHQLMLAALVVRAPRQPELLKLPEDIQGLYRVNFERILKQIDGGRAKEGYYLYPGDKFCKDLCICRLVMTPAGAQKVYPGRMPRGFIFKSGPGQFLRGLYLLLFETRGFKPVYRMHMDSRDRELMKEFNPDGWKRFFERAAELMKINKNIKGLCGSSWFFDPVLKEISPELSYLREVAEERGARFFSLGPSEADVKDATFMSPKRIRLHKEGKYMPVGYMMVIPRKQLLKTNEPQRHEDAKV